MNEVTINELAQFEAAESAVLDLLDQKGEPLLRGGAPMQIELYGPGSEQYSTAQAALNRANQIAGITAAVAAGKGRPMKEDDGAVDRLVVAKLVACTKRLINFPSGVRCEEVYGNRRLGYITRQVENFHNSWENFPAACLKS